MNFLPENYEAPKSASDNYMKLEEGENRFRILSEPILGWIDWKDKKPLRYRMDKKPEKPVDPTKPIKHFWAMIVWNYNESKIQILELTQKTLQRGIESLVRNADWGSPYFYDISIKRSGTKQETDYGIIAIPPKPLASGIRQAFEDKPIYLPALYDGLDPTDPKLGKRTPGVFDAKEVADIPSGSISRERAQQLCDMLQECTEDFTVKIGKFLDENKIPRDLMGITPELANKLEKGIKKDIEDQNQALPF